MTLEPEELVREARCGNGKAFAQVYSFYAYDLYRFALSYTGNGADAEDCVQEAVLLAYKNIAALKKASSFKSWMFKILSNVCKTKLLNPADKLESIPIHEISDTYGGKCQEDTGLSPEMKEALDSLDPEEKQIVLLSIIGRYKSSEIGRLLEMNPGTVRSKLSRALKKLREILR